MPGGKGGGVDHFNGDKSPGLLFFFYTSTECIVYVLRRLLLLLMSFLVLFLPSVSHFVSKLGEEDEEVLPLVVPVFYHRDVMLVGD